MTVLSRSKNAASIGEYYGWYGATVEASPEARHRPLVTHLASAYLRLCFPVVVEEKGKPAMTTLAISCATGGVLGVIAPVALAASAGTALVVDLDPLGPSYPGQASLADLVEQGPRLDDLRPTRRGVAVLRNGGIEAVAARDVIAALARGWPRVVLRLAPCGDPAAGHLGGAVPVVPLLPGGMTPNCERPAVYQQIGWPIKAPGPGMTIKTPPRSTVAALLEGRVPVQSRWVRSWRRVWEMSWV
jgi:hypothetical protein